MGYAHSKPDEVKKFLGTYRKDQAIENSMAEQIENVTEIPTPPEFITSQEDGEKLWYSVCSGLSELGILNQFSMPMLWDYVNQYCLMQDLQRSMKSNGVFESVQALKQYNQASVRLQQIARDFGFTPSSSGRINLPTRKKKLDKVRKLMVK